MGHIIVIPTDRDQGSNRTWQCSPHTHTHTVCIATYSPKEVLVRLSSSITCRVYPLKRKGLFINPRRACAARVTVVALCVCVCVCVFVCLCVQAAHLRLTQLSDKLDILTDLVSCWLQNEFGIFRIIASFRR